MRRAALALATVALALLALSPAAQAEKVVTAAFGPLGTHGGEFGNPMGIAINQTGAGGVAAGTIYVADSNEGTVGTAHNRIQRLSPSGEFERLWGFGVVSGGGTGFEICTVAAECRRGIASQATANGGEVSEPTGIAVNQSSGDVYVLSWDSARIDEFDADGHWLRSWGTDVVSGGGTGFEICTVAAECKNGVHNGDGGSLQFGRSIAVDSAGDLWVGGNNHRFDEFDPSGNFLGAYGWDVNAGGTAGLEKCASIVPGACVAALSGTALGQFGGGQAGPTPYQVTIDSSDNVYALDQPNNRIQRFNPTVTSAASFGTGLPSLSSDQDSMLAVPGGHLLLGVPGSGGHQLLDLNSSGAIVETSLTGAGVPAISGLARNNSTGTIYATTTTGGSFGVHLGILAIGNGPVPALGVTMEPVVTFAGESATFSATVDPNGGLPTNCKFQYSTDQVQWTDVPEPDCSTLAPGGGAQPLSQDVTGLTPNSHYFVRFSAERPYLAGSAVLSGVQEFTTDAVPPVVSKVGAIQVTDTSARLVGTIDPRHADTEYVFQYGTTPLLGSSTTPVDIGAGANPVIVSRVLAGLSPHTTYYFDLLATNAAGPTPSSVQAFTTRTNPPPPPDRRAYEEVTPVDINSGKLFASSSISPDGEAATFCSGSGFGDPASENTFICAGSLARRGADGWRTSAVVWPYCPGGLRVKGLGNPSPDLSRLVIKPACATEPSAGPLPTEGLYLASLVGSPDYRSLTPVSSATSEFIDGTEGFSHVFFTSKGEEEGGAPTSFQNVYEWYEGAVSLVSRRTNGSFFTTASSMPSPVDTVNPESTDGARVFFENSGELYLREAGVTYKVSEPECSVSCTSSAGTFRWATANGEKALFVSPAKLTEDDTSTAGNDLYMFTKGPDPAGEQNLTLLSQDDEPADGTEAGVLGVSGISTDGDVVFFVAKGQLIAGEPIAVGPKVYRWSWNDGSPTIQYLATLNPAAFENTTSHKEGQLDSYAWHNTRELSERPDDVIVSPDGRTMILQTVEQLEPVADTDSTLDVYRWHEGEGWECLSCQPPGTPSAGRSSLEGGFPNSLTSAIGAAISNHRQRIVMAEDGNRVFFVSYDELVPNDTNGDRQDVYEWHGGALNLISSGSGESSSLSKVDNLLIGADASGRDVFFITTDRLVGWDTNDNEDLYDARIGDGFPEPTPSGAPCEGEACRGASSTAPSGAGAGTSVFEGPGNPNQGKTPGPKKCKRGFVKRGGKCVKQHKKKKHHKHGKHHAKKKHPRRSTSKGR